LGATANKKERSCPRFLIVEFFGVRGDARSPVRTENLIRVDGVMESPKLAE
jgi:hypothetical protein